MCGAIGVHVSRLELPALQPRIQALGFQLPCAQLVARLPIFFELSRDRE
jgi:hypothetical protein